MTVSILCSLVVALHTWVIALLTMAVDPGSFLMVVLWAAMDGVVRGETGVLRSAVPRLTVP